MNRRAFFQAATVGATAGPVVALSQATPAAASKDLITHTVHHTLRETPPLLIYSGLIVTPVSNQILIDVAQKPEVSIWNDWNDHDLHDVFAAFLLATPEVPIGSYRIFDTPDIAKQAQQPAIEELEQGYFDIGGMRASRLVDGEFVFASLRLWNVLVDGASEDEGKVEDIMMGMVKHLGQAIGAID